jgi:peptidoglycan hydrolase CwlO-like protein
MRKTNTEGLKQVAKNKKKNALEATEKAIRELIKENKIISFSAVAEKANVSRAYLYQNNDIKERIESLRNQSFSKKSVPSQIRPSESSKDTIIATLKQRNEKLDRENYALRSHLEVAYGLADPDLVEKVGELKKKIGELEQENKNLKEELKNAKDEIDDLKYNLDD